MIMSLGKKPKKGGKPPKDSMDSIDIILSLDEGIWFIWLKWKILFGFRIEIIESRISE